MNRYITFWPIQDVSFRGRIIHNSFWGRVTDKTPFILIRHWTINSEIFCVWWAEWFSDLISSTFIQNNSGYVNVTANGTWFWNFFALVKLNSSSQFSHFARLFNRALTHLISRQEFTFKGNNSCLGLFWAFVVSFYTKYRMQRYQVYLPVF